MPQKQLHKLHKSCNMWNEGGHIHLQITLHSTDGYLESSIGESRLVSEVYFGRQSISGRPAGSRGDRRRSGRASSPHRSLHASLPETSPSWGRRVEGRADIQADRDS